MKMPIETLRAVALMMVIGICFFWFVKANMRKKRDDNSENFSSSDNVSESAILSNKNLASRIDTNLEKPNSPNPEQSGGALLLGLLLSFTLLFERIITYSANWEFGVKENGLLAIIAIQITIFAYLILDRKNDVEIALSWLVQQAVWKWR